MSFKQMQCLPANICFKDKKNGFVKDRIKEEFEFIYLFQLRLNIEPVFNSTVHKTK